MICIAFLLVEDSNNKSISIIHFIDLTMRVTASIGRSHQGTRPYLTYLISSSVLNLCTTLRGAIFTETYGM